MTHAAIYARKSTDQSGVADEAKSVTRQVEHARAYAARKGWVVDQAHIYIDDGISGAEFTNRPGFLRLMNALKPRPPFQVLVMSEESRLGREAIETAYALKQLVTAGVRVFFYLEDRERTLDSPTDKIMLSLAAFADELEREKARQRTYDAMIRKARAGHVTGGRVFGYDNLRLGSHVERRVNEDEAAIVRRIFECCAAGLGVKAIAKRLNDEGVPAPRSQHGRPAGWAPSSLRCLIFRDLYRGVAVWNRTQKRNAWGQAKRRDRAADDWISTPAPALRVVSDELWQAAHRQIAGRRATYLAGTGGNPFGRPPTGGTTKYLLSGLSRCGVCGGGIIVRSRAHGATRQYRYGCYCNWSRGRAVCPNRLEVLMKTADEAVLQLLEREVLAPTVIDAAIADALADLDTPDDTASQRRRLEAEIATCDRELANLALTAAGGGNVPAIVAAIQARQDRRVQLAAALVTLASRTVASIDRLGLRRALIAKAAELRAVLRRRTSDARGLLSTALDGERIVFQPNEAGDGYRVRVPLALDRIFEGNLPIGVASPTGTDTCWRLIKELLIAAA